MRRDIFLNTGCQESIFQRIRGINDMKDSIRELLDDVLGGHRMTVEEAEALMSVRDRRLWEIASAADEMRERAVGNRITVCQEPEYQRNKHLCQCVRFLWILQKTRGAGDIPVRKRNNKEKGGSCTRAGMLPRSAR